MQCPRLLGARCSFEAMLSFVSEAHRLTEFFFTAGRQLDQPASFVIPVYDDFH
jgi:hypothetical protein